MENGKCDCPACENPESAIVLQVGRLAEIYGGERTYKMLAHALGFLDAVAETYGVDEDSCKQIFDDAFTAGREEAMRVIDSDAFQAEQDTPSEETKVLLN